MQILVVDEDINDQSEKKKEKMREAESDGHAFSFPQRNTIHLYLQWAKFFLYWTPTHCAIKKTFYHNTCLQEKIIGFLLWHKSPNNIDIKNI